MSQDIIHIAYMKYLQENQYQGVKNMADIFAWGFSSKENERLFYTLESFTSPNI